MNMGAAEYKRDISMEEALEIDMKIFQAIKSHRLQSLGILAFNAIVDRLNLEPFCEFRAHFGKDDDVDSGNLFRAACMLLDYYESAWLQGLEEEKIRGLCAGALLHNFGRSRSLGRSGEKTTDSENIKTALRGLENAQMYAASKLMGLSARSLEVAQETIALPCGYGMVCASRPN